MLPSPEKQVICLAAEVMSQTPESFMLTAALAEARRVLERRVRSLQGSGDTKAAQAVTEALAAIQCESMSNIDVQY